MTIDKFKKQADASALKAWTDQFESASGRRQTHSNHCQRWALDAIREGTPRVCPGYTQGMPRESPGYAQVTPRVYPGYAQGTPWVYEALFENDGLKSILQKHLTYTLGIPQGFPRESLGHPSNFSFPRDSLGNP